jgi:bis(5'-nucleosyl)-tetraphosphatase (symmetrical)
VATFAVGDIQGCYDALREGLDHVGFDPARDQLWSVGDLVNRGPQSLEVLRFFTTLGDSARCVLGNHDLHLLALHAGNRRQGEDASLADILQAPDREELLHWLRHRPLLHRDDSLGFAMIHAGLPPQWDMDTAQACAREVEAVLAGDDHRAFFHEMYGNKPNRWDPSLAGMARWRYITNCLTRLRFCEPDGALALKEKGPPGSQKPGRVPWYAFPGRASAGQRLVFGHWSTLGYLAQDNVWALDSGCLWGGTLTLLRLDGEAPVAQHVPCQRVQDPARFA